MAKRKNLDKVWTAVIESALTLVDERNNRTAGVQASLAQWLADRTIRINLGHKTGQTNFICGYADEFDLILVDTVQQASGLRRTQSPKADVLAVYELESIPNLRQYNRIWFDNPTALSKEQLARIYHRTKYPSTRWLILGGDNV